LIMPHPKLDSVVNLYLLYHTKKIYKKRPLEWEISLHSGGESTIGGVEVQ